MEKRLVDFSVQPIDTGQYYGFTLDNSPLHQMPDGTIFHNSGKSVMEQSIVGHISRFSDKFQLVGVDCKQVEFNRLYGVKGVKGVALDVRTATEAIVTFKDQMYRRFTFMKEMQVNDIAMIKDREVDYYIWGGKKYQFDEMFEIKIDLDPKDRNYDKLKLEYPEGRRSMIFTIDQIYDHLQKGDWADLHPQMPVYKGINSYLKKDSISKTRGIFVVKAYIFLADELNELMNSDDFRSVEVFKQALGSIARLGRAAEVHLALACQRASGNTINGDLKNNIQMSCLLGGFDDVSSSLMFDKDVSHLAKPKIKGRCFIGSGTEIIETQSYWTKPEKDWEFDEDAELTYNNPIFKDQCKLLGKDIDKLNTGWVEQIPYDANGNPEKSESEVTDEEIEKELKDLDDIDLDDDDEEFSDKDFEIFDEDDDEDKEDKDEDDNKAGDIILPKAEDLEPEIEEIDIDEEPEIDIPQIDPISPSEPKPVKIRFNANKAESPPPTKIKFNFNKKSDDN